MSFKITVRGVSLENISNKYRESYFQKLSYPGSKTQTANVISNAITTTIDNAIQMTEKVHPYTRSSLTTISYMYSFKKVYVEHQPAPPFNCMSCIISCNHAPVGIPVAKTYLEDNRPCYHVIDMFCSFQCAYLELRQRQHLPIYSNSVVLLFDMWSKGTGLPHEELKPAPDKLLLKIFNGPLTHEEYHGMIGSYCTKPSNYVLIPVQQFLEK
jgi:hypothetical protein